MSIDYNSHKCHCPKPKIGVVDRDTDTVYCGICEGVLATLAEIKLVRKEVK